jgi:uncharacterized peroxidase-related enzyme
MMATFAQSPIAFNAWASLLGSLSKALDVKTRDSIGLTVSEVNGCNYCLTVHSFTAEHMAKLPADEIILARKGHASDPKRDAAVQFARKVIEARGKVSDADLKAVRDAGYTDANVIEIVALVAMYSLTNFFNNVFDPRRTFPPLHEPVRSELYPVASTFSESARRRRMMRRDVKAQMHPGTILGNASGLYGCTGEARII